MEDSGLPLESNKSLTIESDLPLPGESSDLGLHLVHSPTLSPSVDIIFVHGLAGHSTLTWCKNRNPELFWPGKWLPLDIELAKARIFTYGYGGDWFAPRCQSQTVQSGFQSTAKNLLFQMRSGVDQDGWTFDIGSIPIVFVAFDIGGVVVKKAYTLGLADPRTSKMADRIAGMLFLATPHGTSTNLAGMLHRIFRAGGMMEPIPIIDMAPIAIVMQAIDIEFRKNATKLSVWSFYDMQTTNARLLRFPLLGGSTSVIRNPKDFSAVLDSDHTNLCKFGSCTEVNYLAVLSGLRAIVQRTVEGPDLIYKPLSFERIEIRLLSIDPKEGPADNDSMVSCVIKQVPLYQAPPYTALSYCWGVSVNKIPIKLNRYTFRVTSNLHAALLRLRQHNARYKYVWVDALCINQGDKEERSIQIGRMAAIYRQAEHVVVWLGEASDISATDLVELKSLDSKFLSTTHTSPSNTAMKTVYQLLAREYWGRMWIIQELAAASTISLLCGVHHIPWKVICSVLGTRGTSLRASQIRMRDDALAPTNSEHLSRFQKIQSFVLDKAARKPITLVEALYRSRYARSTDPKDKLYALLGLVYDGANFIPHPNYSLTKGEAYHKFSVQLLKNGCPLDFIVLRSAGRTDDESLPSWAVDWNDLNDLLARKEFRIIMNNPMESPTPDCLPKIDGNKLSVNGIIIGNIRTATSPFMDYVDRVVHERKGPPPLQPSVPSVDVVLDTIVSNNELEGLIQDTDTPNRLGWITASAAESPVQIETTNEVLHPSSSENARTMEIKRWFEENKPRIAQIAKKERGPRLPLNEIRNLHRHEYCVEEIAKNISIGMQLALVGNVVFGCVHPKCRIGDVVAMIDGCSRPAALRRITSNGYRVVGSAFIYGLSPGQYQLSKRRHQFDIF